MSASVPPVPNSETESLRRPISMQDLSYFMARLRNRKAPGPDGIPNEMLRHALETFKRVILACVNGILSGRKPPLSWLGGLIRFLYKKGDTLDMSNYRPICLQDTIYKVLAAIVTDRLYRISEKYGLLDPSQEGFRRLHSTQRQVQSLHWAFDDASRKKKA